MSGSCRRKEQEGGAQLSGRGKQLQIGKLLQIEPDIDSRSWGTAERGKWMFQARLLLDDYNNWRGNCSMIREKVVNFISNEMNQFQRKAEVDNEQDRCFWSETE